ncbi:MAG: CoA transferase [Chloroflexota bacterium]|nr:CoA transferase [Chloroflexota bacterium]
MSDGEMDMLLSPYSALDLTNESGFLCGKVLADLGADVIKVEPPGGDASRNRPPYYKGQVHPERSLYWFAYNANKRGITLDINKSDGKRLFKQLVSTCDFVLETFHSGYLDDLGLGYEMLAKTNPRIIVTSITPFGQTGPYKGFKASDIIAMAMGGFMYLSGDPDRAPVRTLPPQSYVHAGSEAAVGTMVAHYHRELSGQGQHVDVSLHECTVETSMNAHGFWDLNRVYLRRAGTSRMGLSQQAKQRLLWKCKDGHVAFALVGGAFGASTNRGLVNWLEEKGVSDESIRNMDWDGFDMATASQEQMDSVIRPLEKLFLMHTKAELYEGARQRNMMLYPVGTTQDICEDSQLEARRFWQEVEHVELNTCIRYPGDFIRMSETPCRAQHRAPLIGEHNQEVYGEKLGLSVEDLVALKGSGVI